MVLYNKNKYSDIVIDGHRTTVLKISDDFDYQSDGDTLILKSPTRIPWHHDASPYRYVVTIHSDFDDIDGFQINLSDLYKNTELNTRTDIYGYDKSGNVINHWLKQTDGEFWIKAPLKAGDLNTFCIYFGSGVENLGNGDNVFEFFDDFTSDTLANYKINGGSYSISDGTLYIAGVSAGNAVIAPSTQYISSPYIVEMRASYSDIGGSIDSWVGVLGYQTSIAGTDGYCCQFGAGKVDIEKYRVAHLASTSVTESQNTMYKITGVFGTGNIQATFEDATVSITDTSFTNGYFGIRTFDANAIVDYIFVRKYADQEPYIIEYIKQSRD